MSLYDYSSVGKASVELVVRDNECYGEARAGEHVIVDVSELKNSSTMSACMTADEHAKMLVEREVRAAAAAAKKAEPTLKKMVDTALARIRYEAMQKAGNETAAQE